jgi:hypothetical protein
MSYSTLLSTYTHVHTCMTHDGVYVYNIIRTWAQVPNCKCHYKYNKKTCITEDCLGFTL